jgi:hypothetical protein
LLRELFPNHGFVPLNLPSQAEQAENDPQFFLQSNPVPLVIDGVQYTPGLFHHLKSRIGPDRHGMGRFILIGSHKFTLMQEVSDSLDWLSVLAALNQVSLLEPY